MALTVELEYGGVKDSFKIARVRFLDKEKLLAAIKARHSQVALLEGDYSPMGVAVAAAYTTLDTSRGLSVAKDRVMQLLLNLEGTRQLSYASRKAAPKGEHGYIVSLGPDDLLESERGLYQEVPMDLGLNEEEVLKEFAARAEGLNWKSRPGNG